MAGDHTSYRAFVRRILRAYSRRCADADPDDLAELLALQVDVGAAIDAAVAGLRAQGRSWADIAEATGTTRQAAHKRWACQPKVDTGSGIGEAGLKGANEVPRQAA